MTYYPDICHDIPISIHEPAIVESAGKLSMLGHSGKLLYHVDGTIGIVLVV
jgi:hypothetical protein